ncbi:MAG TPA: TDP-N-acetylfucosamine:lipid II N-acetylfucosaminyltransferase [Methanocorpusculum sp.]|nr:TDP-N-acetylfucosamine:lipid II N-acetylfucosaminyltransferase [Methanocorpusculum sp.]
MPMILHNFNKSTFLRAYIQFLSKYYDIHNHYIVTNTIDQHYANYVYDKILANFSTAIKPSTSIRHPILYFIHSIPIRKKMKQADLIIAHGFEDMWYYFLSPSTLKKTIWVIWGYDLYDYRTRKSSFNSRINFHIKKQLLKKIPYVISNVGDYKLLQKWYGASPKLLQVYSLYGNGCTNVKPHIRKTNDGTINILLGNSAFLTNRHVEGLEILSKYKDEDIKIHIPLSYGDKEYAKSVEEHAREIFGDKVIILDKMMSTESYNDILSTMDIAVFNHNRQQGVGNLTYMFQSGVKIFLNDDNPLCEYYAELNLPVNSINTIPEMSFEEFIYINPSDVQASAQRAQEIFSEETLVKQWNEVFALAKK